MRFIAEDDGRNRQLALLFNIGLFWAIDHDVRDIRIIDQIFERPKAQQFVNQHLFQRELLAPVEGEFQFGKHFADDRAEFFGQFIFAQRGCRFGIDSFEQARKHLFLDLVNALFKAFCLLRRGVKRGFPLSQSRHGIHGFRGWRGNGWQFNALDRRKLATAACNLATGLYGRSRTALHWPRNAKGWPCRAI